MAKEIETHTKWKYYNPEEIGEMPRDKRIRIAKMVIENWRNEYD